MYRNTNRFWISRSGCAFLSERAWMCVVGTNTWCAVQDLEQLNLSASTASKTTAATFC